MLKGFKDFLLRGNVVDLAVAVVVGAAFTAVVTALTNAFLKPLIQVFAGWRRIRRFLRGLGASCSTTRVSSTRSSRSP